MRVYEFCMFFFFKQKTAYEMRISDWSSDVCSSDLRTRFMENETTDTAFTPTPGCAVVWIAALCAGGPHPFPAPHYGHGGGRGRVPSWDGYAGLTGKKRISASGSCRRPRGRSSRQSAWRFPGCTSTRHQP